MLFDNNLIWHLKGGTKDPFHLKILC